MNSITKSSIRSLLFSAGVALLAPAADGSTATATEAAPIEIPADLLRPLRARGSCTMSASSSEEVFSGQIAAEVDGDGTVSSLDLISS